MPCLPLRRRRARASAAGSADPLALLSIGAVLFLVFIAGALFMLFDTAPANAIRDAYRGGQAYYEQVFRYRDRYATDLWPEARDEQRGVTVRNDAAMQPGLTLFASADAPRARLIQADGTVVHEWHRPFSQVWDRTSPVRRPMPDDHVYFRKARLFSNGDIVALYEAVGDTPYGYGLVRLTAESDLVWRNLDNFHHDFDVTEDGRIVALTHGFRHEPLANADQFQMPLLEDFLVVLDAEGNTVSRISLLEALNDSPFRSQLWRIPYYSMEDPLHANGVDYLDAKSARALSRHLPMAAPGQVLVSFRELAGGSLALIEPADGRVLWASHGPWLAQHDPDVLANGNLLVFDNRGNLGGATPTRIIEVDPASGGVVWSFDGPAQRPLQSLIRGSQQPLANGNTLITESSGGRLLEVTRDGELVWEYHNPVRGGPDGGRIAVLTWAERIAPQSLGRSFARTLGRHHDETMPSTAQPGSAD